MVIVAAVAAVVTVYTAGAAATLLGPGFSTFMGMTGAQVMAAGGTALAGGALAGASTGAVVLGAAIGSAAGSAAGQLTAMGLGIQKDFNWGQVAISGLSAGVAAGIAPASSASQSWLLGHQAVKDSTPLRTLIQYGVTGARAAIANAATQGMVYLAAKKPSFSWGKVAASAVSAMSAAAAGDAANEFQGYDPEQFQFGQDLTSRTFSGMASGTTMAAMRGGRVLFDQIAADAFGNALANSIVEQSTQKEKARVKALRENTERLMAGLTLLPPEYGSEGLTLRLPELASKESRYRRDRSDGAFGVADEDLGRSMGGSSGGDPLGRWVTARRGQGISDMVRTSDPQAIGNFRRSNGLDSSLVREGERYFIPNDPEAWGDQRALGQATLDADEAARAVRAKTDYVWSPPNFTALGMLAIAKETIAQRSPVDLERLRAARYWEPGLAFGDSGLGIGEGMMRNAMYNRSLAWDQAQSAVLSPTLWDKVANYSSVAGWTAVGFGASVVYGIERPGVWALQALGWVTETIGERNLEQISALPQEVHTGIASADAAFRVVGVAAREALALRRLGLARPASSLRNPLILTGAGEGFASEAAEAAYAQIRALRMTDVAAVSENTGLSLSETITLKKHLFFGRHAIPLEGGEGFRFARFDAMDDIAFAWKTSQEGALSAEQQAWMRQLAQHELGERSLMARGLPYRNPLSWDDSLGAFGTNPPGAHDLAPRPPKQTFPGYEPW